MIKSVLTRLPKRRPLLSGIGPWQRPQSTAAAVAPFPDENDSENGHYSQDTAPEIHGLGGSSYPEQRPRLMALRERLRKENTGESVTAADRNTRTSTVQLNHSTKTSATSASPPKTKGKTPLAQIDDMRSFLDSLPSVEHSEKALQDRFKRQHSYLRISLTERCNLRCQYCMPEDGVPLQPKDHLLQTDEIIHIAQHFDSLGVSKYRLTGGEPTLRKDLVDIVAGLHELPHTRSIGMTTNGITLTKHLDPLLQAGMTSINISLDTLDAGKFARLTRRPENYYQRVLDSLEAAVGVVPNLKLNCVVMRGTNDQEVADFIALAERYQDLQVRFIEYMPFSGTEWNWEQCVPYEELLLLASEKGKDLTPLPVEDPHDTTKWFTSNGTNRIGFITSMSSHFCAGCNRIRLTADGQIKVCLFDGAEVSLRDVVRLPDYVPTDLTKLVHHALQGKHFKLGGHPDPAAIRQDADSNRPMTLIGG